MPALRTILSSLLACVLAACGQEPRRPNVLLISIDTLRPDHLSCYGYGRQTSPRIDRLAAEGVLFENHISSSSWTLPAHAAMFTSVNDSVHGCHEATGTALSPAFTTLAERFQAAGYATGGFFAGPYLHPAFGLGQGFDDYVNCCAGGDVLDGNDVQSWAMDPTVMRASHQGVTNETVFAAGRDWLESHREQPFFAFVHLWDVHFDFEPPAPYDTMFDKGYEGEITGRDFFFDPRIDANLPERDKAHLVALYDGEIAWTDSIVGRFLDALEAWGLVEDTIVAVTSDHGTEFFEHGWKGHRTTLYDELIRIPLVIRYPRAIEAGRRVSAQTRIVDLGPTLLELAKLAPPDDVMGASLVALARGDTDVFPHPAISELYSVGRRLRSVRTLESKLLDDQARESVVWFDLVSDPRELHPSADIATGAGREAAMRYRRATDDLAERARRRPGDPAVPALPVEVSTQLGALGYADDPEQDRDD